MLHNFRCQFHQNLPFDLKVQGFPAEHIAWAEVLIFHIASDLTGGDDSVPHVEVSNHTYEWFLCIEASAIGVLLLAQDGDGSSSDGPSLDKFLGGRLAVHPQLSQPSGGVPGSTHRVPGVGIKFQWREVCFPIPSIQLDVTLCITFIDQKVIVESGCSQREDSIFPPEIWLISEKMCRHWENLTNRSSNLTTNNEAFWLQHQLPETGGHRVESGFRCHEYYTISVGLLWKDKHFTWKICTGGRQNYF